MNMSFSKTTEQMYLFTKTVTRRDGHAGAKVGQVVWAIEKGQGLKLGESVKRIHEIQFVDLRWERLDLMLTNRAYGESEVVKEGFPDWTPEQFVEMYCEMNKKRSEELTHRMEFRFYIRETYKEFTFDGETYVLAPDKWELQADGTLAGFMSIADTETNQMLFDTLRFQVGG